jgi:hypothetical protein
MPITPEDRIRVNIDKPLTEAGGARASDFKRKTAMVPLNSDSHPFSWRDLDRRILSQKTHELAQEMHGRIGLATRRIGFETAQRRNTSAYRPELLAFHEKLLDEWAQRLYTAYCETWALQGRTVTPEFIRAIRDRPIAKLFVARRSSVIAEMGLHHRRTGGLSNISGVAKTWALTVTRVAARWNQKLEAEAAAAEYRNPPSSSKHKDVSAPLVSKTPGRRPVRPADFTNFAGKLWIESKGNAATVQHQVLSGIAARLDEQRYLPPTKYLERKYANELRMSNSKHAKSKVGPIMTWTRLIQVGDKDQLRGMRRTLSRCASKVK